MLNIKSPEAHRLARELAELEGSTLTEAVTHALQRALAEHANRRAVRRQVMDQLIAGAREARAAEAHDLFADLYDEQTGLPR